ncbi:MAG: carboxypeptidase regulatory-like domain-containing protein [Proteobacteria bacterium]|nr:carboxypeptidase regulatory-like domain-containing protein [Pseudomonadota bacterium]
MVALAYVCVPVPVHPRTPPSKARSKGLSYPSYETLTALLEQISEDYPDICHLESAGQSVQGRELWWVRLSDHASVKEAEPSVTLIGSMHGDEPVGLALCLEMIRDLTENYGTDNRTTLLLNQTEIRIMPLMNPDGYEAQDRYNAHGADLNRNFPDASITVSDAFNTLAELEPETQVLMAWTLDDSSTLSANFHTGSLLVNYPLDYTLALSPDDALFQSISLAYAMNNTDMYDHSFYENGIVRGAVWYEIYGSLQDWAYLGLGENHVTVEVSTDKSPDADLLLNLWDSNRESILAFMETVHTGIGGQIRDYDSNEPLKAWVSISDNDHLVFSHAQTGYFQRMLLPGTYDITVGAPGYHSRTFEGQTVSENMTTRLDLTLEIAPAEDLNGDFPSNWPVKNPGSIGDSPPSNQTDDDPVDPISSSDTSDTGCFIGILR